MTTASDEPGEPQRRIALVTIGQTPRDDAVPEIVQMIARPVLVEEFGVLDDLDDGEIAAQMPGPGDESLYTRLRDGRHVVVSTSFVARRLATLVGRIDRAGHDIIAIISTGVFERLASRTPLINGQRVVDAWIEALVMGDSQIGIVYPLQRQTLERHSHQAHGTLIQNPHVLALSGEDFHLEDTAARLRGCDLVLMHSVGYTEGMARDMAALTGKPVVTARRIIAGAIRLQLFQLGEARGLSGEDLLEHLPQPTETLTRREREVLALMLDGLANKAIGRTLGISHRTVEIHRARAMIKLGASSVTELIRRALMAIST
jgi:protein AroM